MHSVYSVEQVRAAEAVLMARLPDGVLMQRAAHALSAHCVQLLQDRLLGRVYGARIVLLVGGGNNGGDALFAGARLAGRGAKVTALVVDPARVHPAGLTALVAAGGRASGPDPRLLTDADLVVDGLLGLGGRGGLRDAAIDLADAARDAFTVAVDLPSGVDADTGAAGEHVVRANVTVTFGALKPGVVVGGGADLAGEVRLVDIGLSLADAQSWVLEAHDVGA
ncbi:MAG: NAD(P)H-hydrate epimerase, partial [Jatrophihabitantaceae bacterium]